MTSVIYPDTLHLTSPWEPTLPCLQQPLDTFRVPATDTLRLLTERHSSLFVTSHPLTKWGGVGG